MNKATDFISNHKKPIIIFAAIFIVVLVAGLLFFVQPKPVANTALESSTVRLSRMDIEQIVTATGTARSIDSRSLTTSQTGKVLSVAVTVGQVVKEGDTLCVFDTSALDLSITSTQTSIETAQAQYYESLTQAEDMVSSAYDQYAYDKGRLDAEAQKAWDALEAAKTAVPSPTGQTPGTTDPISALQTAYDAAVSTRDATLRADNSAITSAENALANQRLTDTTASLQAQLDTYLQQKEETTLRSPIDGTITTVNAKVNEYAGMDAPIFVVEDLSKLEIAVSLPEYDATQVATKLKVHFTTDALQGIVWDGTIQSISPVASEGNFTVTIAVTSPLGGLKSGMSVKVNIVCDKAEDVFAVPYGALVENANGGTVIYVITEESSSSSEAIWHEISVATGLETDYYIEISNPSLTEGLLVDIDPERLNSNAPSDSIMDMF